MGKSLQKSAPVTTDVKTKEFILYLMGVFFYTTMTGMVGSYRQAYLIDTLFLSEDAVSFYNGFYTIFGFIMSFVYSTVIDNRKIGKGGKFRPLVMLAAVPSGIFTVLTFVTPKGLAGTELMIYLLIILVLYDASTSFGNVINMLAVVMTPNHKERDKIMSFRSISSAVGNSAPLVMILVIALFVKDEQWQYIATAALCGILGAVTMFIGSKCAKERITYSEEKKNPFEGYAAVLSNKYAWVIIISEFLKNFRSIASYMGVFLAAALLGSKSKYLLFGLPTGIGTAVGMLVINMLLKKFNSKVLYIASGIYSIIANTAAFVIGYMYFTSPSKILQIVFIVFLFLIGLQFGASNLLPSMFQADVLETLELKTGKRLDATLPFIIGLGTLISRTVAQTLSPKILYGDGSIIQYVQATEANPNPEQSLRTKLLMLFFYTIFHGIMMFLAGVPFFFYKLTGKTKEEIHERVLANREKMAKDA